MNREKWINLAWVLVLVPLVLNIYMLIKHAGFQEVKSWPLQMLLNLILLAVLLFIPRATGWIYDRLSNKA